MRHIFAYICLKTSFDKQKAYVEKNSLTKEIKCVSILCVSTVIYCIIKTKRRTQQ